jgi:hypothetical protein
MLHHTLLFTYMFWLLLRPPSGYFHKNTNKVPRTAIIIIIIIIIKTNKYTINITTVYNPHSYMFRRFHVITREHYILRSYFRAS